MITPERLREVLHYDPDTGKFTWRVSRRCVRAGDEAGGLNKHLGYRYIGVDGRRIPSHRLAWLYMTGDWPDGEIDHINRDRADNRWSNLRAASATENRANSKLRADNSSGLRGVVWDFQRRLWMARIKNSHIGRFATKEEAARAYDAAAIRLFGDFANLNFPVQPIDSQT
jgi:hypothetical protein